MSHQYKPVLWNGFKKRYDALLWCGILLYIGLFVGISLAALPAAEAPSMEILLIRAFGTAAFIMLSLILCIGPLARLDRRFLPLLYNRRHFGVSMFIVALLHFALALVWYHGFGELNPLVSMLASNPNYDQIGGFPFESLGFVALLILFVMAATSHDIWLANLGAPIWKALHMGVYLAWGLLVLHIALGILQHEQQPFYLGLLAAAVALVAGLHAWSGTREFLGDRRLNQRNEAPDTDGFIVVANVSEIAEKRAKIVRVNGSDRIAVFRYDGKISAIGNACQHQNGPLGEGRIIDGCVTCPWHGYQYRPEDGRSPAPFTERVPTFRVKVEAGRILLDPRPLPPGTAVPPAVFDPAAAAAASA